MKMRNCICHTEAVAFGYLDCEACETSLIDRAALDCKAIEAYPESKTLREAITKYLAKLDPHSLEWDSWIEAYTEGKLANYFGVQI